MAKQKSRHPSRAPARSAPNTTEAAEAFALAQALDPAIRARIAARVEEEGKCLVWTGHCSGSSPVIKLTGNTNKSVRRLVWMAEHQQPLPPELLVQMHCGNHLCVSPAHMRLMTQAQAGALAAKSPGHSSPAAYARRCAARRKQSLQRLGLTLEAIADIQSASLDVTGVALAKRYNISPQVVSKIRRGETWAATVPLASVFALGQSRKEGGRVR